MNKSSNDTEHESTIIKLQEKMMVDIIEQFSLLTLSQKTELVSKLCNFFCIKCARTVKPDLAYG